MLEVSQISKKRGRVIVSACRQELVMAGTRKKEEFNFAYTQPHMCLSTLPYRFGYPGDDPPNRSDVVRIALSSGLRDVKLS